MKVRFWKHPHNGEQRATWNADGPGMAHEFRRLPLTEYWQVAGDYALFRDVPTQLIREQVAVAYAVYLARLVVGGGSNSEEDACLVEIPDPQGQTSYTKLGAASSPAMGSARK